MELSQVLQALKAADAAGNTEDARQLAAMAQQLMAAPTAAPAAKPKSSVSDLGYSALSGIGSLVQFPGQLYGLATGDADNSLSKMGASIRDYASAQQSEGLKERKTAQQEAIKKAGEQGFLSEAGTAISSTMKDPVLFANFITENIPNLIPGFGVTRGTLAVGMRMAAKEIAEQGLEGEAKRVALDAARTSLTKKAEALAVGTAAAQQGADVGAQAYTDIYAKLKAQGASDEEAADKALSLARASGASGAVISLLSTKLPGARALEQSFAGAKGLRGATTGALKGVLGEGASEAVEEGGGALARNAAMASIDPTQNIMQGVGAAVGQGALLGGVMGGGAGLLNSRRETNVSVQEARQKAEAEAAAQQQQGAAQEADVAAKRADPKFLSGVLDTYDQYKTQIDELKAEIKANSGKNATALQQAKRAQAAATLDGIMKSPEYAQHAETVGTFAPELNALRIEQDKAKTDADAAAQAQAEADRQDPAKQTALHTQQAALVRQKTDLLAQSSQLARSGDTEQALALRAQATELDKQIAAMAPLMGKLPEPPRTYTSTPTQTEEAQIRARLAQLVGGTNARGKEMTGAYAQAKTDEDAAAILAESAPLQARLREIESLRARTGQQADILAEQENVPNEPGQSWSSAPLPGINTDALAEGVFGKTENMIPGTPQTTGDKTRLPTPPTNVVTRTLPNGLRVTRREAGAAPDTTQLEQESMFPDMEQGGNAGTPLENLRTQIDQLKTRPNMPAATLAQLDNYRRVLDNPALENADNARAQNALADIADNLNRIAYRGEGQGVERSMSTAEVRAKLTGVGERLKSIANNIERAKDEVRSASPESQLDRSNELRNLRRTQQELVAEQTRLRDVLSGAVTDTSYPNRPTKYVQLPLTQTGEGETSSLLLPADAKKPAPRVEDATDEQIARAKRGDKRGYEVGTVNAEPGGIKESGFQLQPGEDGEMETVATADTERVAPQAPTTTGTARVTRVNERTVGLERAGPEDADIDAAARYLDAELSLAPEDRRTIDLFDEVFGPASKINDLVQNAEQDVRNVSAAVAAVETDLEAARKELANYSAALQKALVEDPDNKAILTMKRLAESRMVDLNRAATERQRVADEYGKVAKFYEGELNAETTRLQQAVSDALAAERKTFDRLIQSTRMLDVAEKNARLMHVLVEHPDLEGLVNRAAKDLARIPPNPATSMIARIQSLTDFDAAQELMKAAIPIVEKTLGEKAADAYSNYMHARLALNLRDRVNTLRNTRDELSIFARKQASSTAKKMADAKQSLQARGETLSAAKIKHEVAVAETEALIREYQKTEKELKFLQTAPLHTGAEAKKALDAEVAASKKVESLQAQLDTLTARFKDDLAAANKKLQNAEELRADVYANEQALRDKQTLPLADKMNGELKFLREDAPKQEADIQKAIDGLMQQVADANAKEGASKQELESMKALEESVYAQLRNYARGFVQVQEDLQQAQAVADSIANEAVDLAYERVHASVATAVSNATRDQIKARIASARFDFKQADANLVARIKETASVLGWKGPIVSAPASRRHTRALMNMRRKMQEQRASMRAKHAAALKQMHRQMIGVANPEMEVVDALRADIDAARVIRKDVVDQIENMRRQLEAIQAERKQIEVDIEQRAAARLSEVRAMMPSRREGTPLTPAKPVDLAPAITDADRVLAASLAAQRDAVDAADATVNAAYAVAEDAVDGPFPEYFEARKALQEAVLARSKVEEKLREVERKQLDMAAKLPTEREALPTRMVTAPTPEVKSSAEAIPATGKVLASGQMKGPVVEEIKQAQEDFEQRIAGVDNKGALAKELGGYKGQIAANEEALARLTKADPAESRMVQFVQEEVRQATAWLDKVYAFTNAELDGLVSEILRNPTKNKKLTKLVQGAQTPAKDLHAHLIDAAQEAVKDARTRLQNITKDAASPAPVDATLRVQRGMSPARNAMMQAQLKEKRFDLFTKLRNLEAQRAQTNGLLPEAVESAIKKTEKEYAQTERDYAALTRGVGRGDARVRQLLEQQVVLEEKVRAIEARMDTLVSEKKAKRRAASDVERIASSQTTGRTGTLMKKEMVAGDWNVGDAERNAAIATGTQNRATAQKIVASPTAQQVVRQAKVDLAQGPLQRNMERAKIERELEEARAERSAAKERADAVSASKASAATKAKVAEQLAAAEARVSAADKALTEEMAAASQFRSDRQTTEVDEDVVRAVQDGRVLDAAKLLAARGSTPEVRERAAKLIPMLMRTKISVEPVVMVDGKSVAGKYDPSNNAITMAPGGINEEDLMHEMTHAATDRTLLAPDNTLTDDQRAAKRELEALRVMITASPKFANEDIGNTREFAAEVFSNEALRAKMDNLGKPLSLGKRFINLIGRLVGWGPVYTPDKPLSKKAEALVERIMQPSRKIDTTAAAAPSAWRGQAVHDFGDLAGTPIADLRKTKPDTRTIKERFLDDAAMRAEYNLADMHNYIVAAMRQSNSKIGQQAEFDIRAAGSASMLSEAFIKQGAPEHFTDSKGFSAIRASDKNAGAEFFKAVSALPGADAQVKFELMTNYMMALRGLRVGPEKVGPTVTRAQLQAVVDQVRNDPSMYAPMEAARAKYNAYNDRLVQMAVKAGAISAAEGKRMTENGDYVPMYREHDGKLQAVVDGRYETIGDIAHTPYMHALKGGEERVLPINETIFLNTELLTKMALINTAKNNIGHTLAQVGKPHGKMQIGEGTGPASTQNLTWKEDGKDYHLILDTEGTPLSGIPTAMLAQSIDGYHATLPQTLMWMQKANDYLRAGVTRMPMYTLRQLIKDPASAAIIRGMDGGPLTAVARAFKEYGKIMVGKTADIDRLSRMGLVQNAQFTGTSTDDMHALARQMAGGNAPSAIRTLLNFLDKSAGAANATTQLQLYNDGLKKGMSEVEALHHARESMNFHKRGASATIQQMNRTMIFFNSGIQALNVLQNTLRGKMPFEERLKTQQKFMHNAVMVFAAGFLYAAGMGDDEEYKKLKIQDKLGNLHIFIGDTPIKLPISYFETGGMMWAAGQALAAMASGDAEGDAIIKAMGRYALTAVPGGGGLPIGPGVKQVGEWVTNKDFTTFRDIVPASKAGLTPEAQVSASTPEGMRMVANALGVSPDKLRHAFDSLFGVATTSALQVLDQIMQLGDTEKTARGLSETPFISSLFQNKTSSEALDEMYSAANDATAVKKTLDRMKSEGQGGEKIRRYVEENKDALVTDALTSKFTQAMAALTKAISVTEASDKTSEEKKTLIDKFKQQKNDIAETMNKARKELVNRLA